MTIKEIWRDRTDRRLVAYRPGKKFYVPLGYKTFEQATSTALDSQQITAADLQADDWEVGEVIPHDDLKKPDLVGTVKDFRKA